MRGRIAVWAVAWALSLLFAGQACADGVAYGARTYSSLQRVYQHEQRAAIVHQDGIERLVIAVDLSLEDEDKGLWIFPVPGRPEDVEVDVLDRFPEFSGKDVRGQAWQEVHAFMSLAMATQVYPIFFLRYFMSHAGGPAEPPVAASLHNEIEKWGIHAEVITAGSLNALAEYLQSKEARLAEEDLQTFAPYLSDEYVLVLAWIASREELEAEFPDYLRRGSRAMGRWPCLYVEFPTERAFYPLQPTRAYGSTLFPIWVYVVGYVRAEAHELVRKRFRVAYCEQDGFPADTPERFVRGLPEGSVRFTVIGRSHVDVNKLTFDLWLEPYHPPLIGLAKAIHSLSRPLVAVLLWVLVVAGFSYVSAGVTAAIIHAKWKPYARLGLWNLLTLIAFAIAVALYRSEDGEPMPHRFAFLFWFSLVYIMLTGCVKSFLMAMLS